MDEIKHVVDMCNHYTKRYGVIMNTIKNAAKKLVRPIGNKINHSNNKE